MSFCIKHDFMAERHLRWKQLVVQRAHMICCSCIDTMEQCLKLTCH